MREADLPLRFKFINLQSIASRWDSAEFEVSSSITARFDGLLCGGIP